MTIFVIPKIRFQRWQLLTQQPASPILWRLRLRPFPSGSRMRRPCNEKNEKGKLCNGHLKQLRTAGEASEVHLRGRRAFKMPDAREALHGSAVGPRVRISRAGLWKRS